MAVSTTLLDCESTLWHPLPLICMNWLRIEGFPRPAMKSATRAGRPPLNKSGPDLPMGVQVHGLQAAAILARSRR